ncbi:MAG TPA: MerR family transcriptional regulator [Chloroflexota bacterium]|nr:MerR family transcriptional regulator [Chloroflexota bacterium]
MKIGAVAKVLNVPVPTIRRWTQEFAAGLSPGARTGDGAVRVFLHEDVLLLRAARDLLAQGMTYTAVRRKLADQGKLQPVERDGQQAPAADGPADEEEREHAVRFVRSVLDDTLAPHLARIAALEQQLHELRDILNSGDPSQRRRWPFKG